VFVAVATRADASPTTWATSSESPRAIDARDFGAREGELLPHCGVGDAALRDVARGVLDRKRAGLATPDTDALSAAQRAAGEPHVWPRAWIVSGRALAADALGRKLDAWRQSFRDLGERRCGIASGTTPDGTEIVVAVAVDALADLSPLPVRVRTGQWLSLAARMLVPATAAQVIVMGPSGAPRSVPASIANGHVRARFAPESPGSYTVQVVADVSTGPRPVIEASVFSEIAPPASLAPTAAPGEDATAGSVDENDALLRMLVALRRAERLAAPVRDSRLDALARAHARKMAAARTVGHDVGDGDPSTRLRDAGMTARDAGENVAHAATVALAHRALYASPSHRANLLRADFDRVGVAVVDDKDGSVWIAELFASGLR
jgi:uncharacterized protein YkwD